MANPDVIDHNKLTTKMHFVIPTKGLKPGHSVMGGLDKTHLMQVTGVKDIDYIVPAKITTHVVTGNSKEKVGVNFYHGTDMNTNKLLATNEATHVFAPHPDGHQDPENQLSDGTVPSINDHTYKGAFSLTPYHVVSTGYRVPDEITLPIISDENEIQDGLVKTTRRQAERWHQTEEKNIAAGSYHETIDGKKYVAVFPSNEEGVENAVHKYIERVGDVEFEGKYSTAAREPVRHPSLNQTGFMMDMEDHQTAVDDLKLMFSSTNPFKDGLHAHVTNVGKEPMKEPTTIQLTLHRNPISYGDGVATVDIEPGTISGPITRDIIDSSMRTDTGELPSALPVLKNPEPFQIDMDELKL